MSALFCPRAWHLAMHCSRPFHPQTVLKFRPLCACALPLGNPSSSSNSRSIRGRRKSKRIQSVLSRVCIRAKAAAGASHKVAARAIDIASGEEAASASKGGRERDLSVIMRRHCGASLHLLIQMRRAVRPAGEARSVASINGARLDGHGRRRLDGGDDWRGGGRVHDFLLLAIAGCERREHAGRAQRADGRAARIRDVGAR